MCTSHGVLTAFAGLLTVLFHQINYVINTMKLNNSASQLPLSTLCTVYHYQTAIRIHHGLHELCS